MTEDQTSNEYWIKSLDECFDKLHSGVVDSKQAVDLMVDGGMITIDHPMVRFVNRMTEVFDVYQAETKKEQAT